MQHYCLYKFRREQIVVTTWNIEMLEVHYNSELSPDSCEDMAWYYTADSDYFVPNIENLLDHKSYI